MDLMHKLAGEGLVSLAEVRRRLAALSPERDHHQSTLWRWCQGITTRRGRRVQLEHVTIAGRHLTSLKAVDRFLEATGDSLVSLGGGKCETVLA